MRTKPAAIDSSPAPGDKYETGHDQQYRDQAKGQHIDRSIDCACLAVLQGIQPQRPVVAENNEVSQGEVVAEYIQRGGKYEQGEEADLGQ